MPSNGRWDLIRRLKVKLKFKLQYDALLEVRYERHPAELVTIREVENGSTYPTASVV